MYLVANQIEQRGIMKIASLFQLASIGNTQTLPNILSSQWAQCYPKRIQSEREKRGEGGGGGELIKAHTRKRWRYRSSFAIVLNAMLRSPFHRASEENNSHDFSCSYTRAVRRERD